jgi:excisionase family DNA binding protein
MNTTEAAAALGLTQGRIRQLARAGMLKAVKTGRDWLIDDESLRRYQSPRAKYRPRKQLSA